MGWDLGLRDELSHIVTNAPCQVPDIAVSGTIDGCHVASIWVDVSRRDGRLRLGNQLLIVVCLQVPDVDSTALITHNEFCLVGMQTHAINGCVHLEDTLTLQVPGPVGS